MKPSVVAGNKLQHQGSGEFDPDDVVVDKEMSNNSARNGTTGSNENQQHMNMKQDKDVQPVTNGANIEQDGSDQGNIPVLVPANVMLAKPSRTRKQKKHSHEDRDNKTSRSMTMSTRDQNQKIAD